MPTIATIRGTGNTMKTIKSMIDWKLLSGSHKWPGPEGGTCINEAAIVVAGLKYRAVGDVSDLPPCFSPVIGAYLIKLNDDMAYASRQRLIEFAPRLSGSADSRDVEKRRLEYIVIETVRRIVSSAMDAAGLKTEAEKCRAVTTFAEATAWAAWAAEAAWAAWAAEETEAAEAARTARAARTAKAAKAAEAAVDDACIEIVRGALYLGNQAPPIEVAQIKERVARARSLEPTA